MDSNAAGVIGFEASYGAELVTGEHNDLKVNVRLTREEIRELDAWVAAQRVPGLGRAEALKRLMKLGLNASWGWKNTKAGLMPDEGLRPEQLTCENDG